jgi:exopolyphosphatase/guanosine-5'-triphosphate,3'-diphosphate pyrophosphatase
METYAAIDIGSNAARLNISSIYIVNNKFFLQKILLLRLPLRLGETVYEKNIITREKQEKLIKTVKVFKDVLDFYEIDSVRAYATSAMREANNKDKVIQNVYKKTKILIKDITGLQEANIIANLLKNYGETHHTKLLIDVGGGSTQISIFYPNGEMINESFKIGTVRMLKNNIDSTEWDRMIDFTLKNTKKDDLFVIGSGGNINFIKKRFGSYDNPFLDLSLLIDIYDQLQGISIEERIINYSLNPDRADVIVPALIIYIKILQILEINKIACYQVGLSDGIIMEQFYEKNPELIKNK